MSNFYLYKVKSNNGKNAAVEGNNLNGQCLEPEASGIQAFIQAFIQTLFTCSCIMPVL